MEIENPQLISDLFFMVNASEDVSEGTSVSDDISEVSSFSISFFGFVIKPTDTATHATTATTITQNAGFL